MVIQYALWALLVSTVTSKPIAEEKLTPTPKGPELPDNDDERFQMLLLGNMVHNNQILEEMKRIFVPMKNSIGELFENTAESLAEHMERSDIDDLIKQRSDINDLNKPAFKLEWLLFGEGIDRTDEVNFKKMMNKVTKMENRLKKMQAKDADRLGSFLQNMEDSLNELQRILGNCDRT